MGKVREPKRICLDAKFMTEPGYDELKAQGHNITCWDFSDFDIVISDIAQMTPRGRLPYVVKKLKEIVKEIVKDEKPS